MTNPLDCTLDELVEKNTAKPVRNQRKRSYPSSFDSWTPNTKKFKSNNNSRNNSDWNSNSNQWKEKQAPLPIPPSIDYYLQSKKTPANFTITVENNQLPENTNTDKKRTVTEMISNENIPKKAYAFVTLVMRGDNYTPGALILAHSLKLSKTNHSLIVFVTNDVSSAAKSALNLLFDHVLDVPYLSYPDCKELKTFKQRKKYESWICDSFTKWNVLQLNDLLSKQLKNGIIPVFDKILFLDSDIIIIKNIDHLLTDDRLQSPAGTFSSPWAIRDEEYSTKYANRMRRNKYNSGLLNPYPKSMQHFDEIPAECIFDGLYNNGFVAPATSMLLKPNVKDFKKLIQMLDYKWIANEYMSNNITLEEERMEELRKVKQSQLLNFKLKQLKECKTETDNNDRSADGKRNIEKKIQLTSELNLMKEIGDEFANGERNTERRIGFSNCYSGLDEQSIVYFYFYHRIPWYFIDSKYNFVPWHFRWLEEKYEVDGGHGIRLRTPSVLHFFGVKPWVSSPLEWRDLQAWWAMAFHLLNFSSEGMYAWTEEQNDMIQNQFNFEFILQLPLPITDDDVSNAEEKALVGNNDGIDKNTARMTCFWCFELAKRKGLNPKELIAQGKTEDIEWIFHIPIDLLTGQLTCEHLIKDFSYF